MASVFDEYDIGEELGSGNYSVVKKGVHKETGKEYAIKIINKEQEAESLDMIAKEIKILKSLDHPNINRLRAVFETDDKMYLVLDLIKGGELFDRIVELSKYSEATAAMLVRQMVEALKHTHSKNIVHRDLKPENLLLVDKTLESPVLLADFGLAEVVDDDNPLSVPVGTPGYVAPEVVECLEREYSYGIPVDMWAIGVITYIMLCGYPPFYSEDDDEVFDQILDGDYSFPENPWNSISDTAKDLVVKLLEVDPKKRLKAEEALAHPWLASEAPDAPLDETVAELKKFNAKRKWKAAILATVAMTKMSSKLAALRTNSVVRTDSYDMAHGGLAQAGKVRGLTPKIEKQEKKRKKNGRAGKREKYNRRYVNAVPGRGGRGRGPNANGGRKEEEEKK